MTHVARIKDIQVEKLKTFSDLKNIYLLRTFVVKPI